MTDRYAKEILARFPPVGQCIDINWVTIGGRAVKSNVPPRSLDCLMHNLIGRNLSITDLIAEATSKCLAKIDSDRR